MAMHEIRPVCREIFFLCSFLVGLSMLSVGVPVQCTPLVRAWRYSAFGKFVPQEEAAAAATRAMTSAAFAVLNSFEIQKFPWAILAGSVGRLTELDLRIYAAVVAVVADGAGNLQRRDRDQADRGEGSEHRIGVGADHLARGQGLPVVIAHLIAVTTGQDRLRGEFAQQKPSGQCAPEGSLAADRGRC